jgi:hypothetical protein
VGRDVDLGLFCRQTQFRVRLLVDKLKLCLELPPKVFVYLRNLASGFEDTPAVLCGREGVGATFGLEAGLAEAFLPRVEVYAEDRDLVVSDDK